ncbi:MAG: LysR family transcriptional regulator [Myxococcota bacterium]
MTAPDVESLRCFVEAARSGTFRAAAKKVALSPAAFGDRIRRLEEELDCRLFERTTRRIALTPAGERLAPHAWQCLQQMERCGEIARRSRGRERFALRLGTRFELGMSWLTPALGPLEEENPERALHLVFGDTKALLLALRRGDADCIVTSARITEGGLRYARLHEERYVFAGAPSLLNKNPLRRPQDAAKHRLLDIDAGLPLFRYLLDSRPGTEVWAFAHRQFLGTIGPIRERVRDGSGVAVLPRYFVAEDLKRKRLRRILARHRLPSDWFRLIWREDHPRQEAMEDLASSLLAMPLQ